MSVYVLLQKILFHASVNKICYNVLSSVSVAILNDRSVLLSFKTEEPWDQLKERENVGVSYMERDREEVRDNKEMRRRIG